MMKGLSKTFIFFFVLTILGFSQSLTTYKNDAANFSVSLPGKPVLSTNDIPTEAGTVKLINFTVEASDGIYYIGVSEYPKEFNLTGREKTVLDESLTGAMADFESSNLLSRKDITLGAFKGIEFQISSKLNGGSVMVSGRFFLVGSKIYQLLATFTEGNYNSNKDNINSFLTSFKLLK